MVDVDHFKLFNDALGHLAGDEALRKVAQALAKNARRAADIAARYGGEEFALLLPESDMKAALLVAERARQAVKALAIKHPHSDCSRQITISLGVSTIYPSELTEPQQLVRLADAALYQAKAAGRDQIRSSSEAALQ